VQTQRSANGST